MNNSMEKKSHKKLIAITTVCAVLVLGGLLALAIIGAMAIGFDIETIGDVCEVTVSGSGTLSRKNVEELFAKEDVAQAKEVRVVIGNGIKSIGIQAFSSAYVDLYDEEKETEEQKEIRAHLNNITEVVIPKSVEKVGQYAFHGLVGTTVYCEAKSQPSDWDSYWTDMDQDVSVVWNCEFNDEAEDGYIYTTVDGLRYGIKDDEAVVARQKSTIVSETVKKEIIYKENKYPVTAIADMAFYNCPDLEGVNMSTTIESIGDYAFSHSGITGVFVPDGVKTIGAGAFERCDNLSYVLLSNGLEEIGVGAFSNCRSLTSITLPATLTSISNYMFSWCDKLEEVYFLENITSIGEFAFDNCRSLKSVLISEGVTEIGRYAFSGCTSLTIRCKFESQPSTWSESWNIDNCAVKWKTN